MFDLYFFFSNMDIVMLVSASVKETEKCFDHF